jgi:hypothetical protein
MKLSVGALATTRLLLRLVAVAVLLTLVGGVVMTASHRDAVAAAERAEQVNAARDVVSWNAFQVRVAAQKRADDKVDARLAARDRAAAQRAVRKQAAAEKAAQEQVARQKALRQRIAREKAARQQAAREAVVRARAARLAAIREQARQKVADRRAAARAARERDAERAAKRQARKQAAARASTKNVVTGEMTAPDVAGALTVRVGGTPGQRYRTLSPRQQTRLRALVRSVANGSTYACPRGSGGGFRDIAAGARVLVRNGTGTLLAATALTGGRVSRRGCTFAFTAPVAGAPRYRIGVTSRGAVTFTRSTLVANGWRVGLTAVPARQPGSTG